jgi:hypothetical protein
LSCKQNEFDKFYKGLRRDSQVSANMIGFLIEYELKDSTMIAPTVGSIPSTIKNNGMY